ncbi:multiple sugar transport system permease protein [Pullulanibacillus pueri]|uniref:Sugar ABC transporter ATP-binding protein n=1 Tax=Pullulanibacillus pueri TaxID=1437324 RepID=A0A8J2ZR54_9BACL|nr:carbohydrate ABC transporter permease [Pullulanibacillus pueri]MBM7679896.1 multiple sugar transport system permease protein [Pullulanibacillus pueri]GGH73371.1 sugar ABC transporter ATP-binding protein [Pullulanibacillus pueri]
MQLNSQVKNKTKEQISENYRLKRMLVRGLIYLILIVGAAICLLPFYSMIISSTHSNTDISNKFLLLPGDQFIENYKRLIKIVPIWRGFLNSVFLTVVGTSVTLYFSAMTAYGFSKYDFKYSKVLFSCVLATLMIPGELSIIGFFRLMGNFHMLNTYWPLILPGIANAFGTFFLKQNCDQAVSSEIIESARMDGCGELKAFHRLVLPLLKPALATFGILAFIGQWNSFMLPVITLFDNNLQPLPVMVAMTRGQFGTDYGAQYVGIVISIVPIMLLFAFLSRKIMDGVSAGALKE